MVHICPPSLVFFLYGPCSLVISLEVIPFCVCGQARQGMQSGWVVRDASFPPQTTGVAGWQ